jgi:hypothetical protein
MSLCERWSTRAMPVWIAFQSSAVVARVPSLRSAGSGMSFIISSARSPFSCTELPRSIRIESSRLSVRRASVAQRSAMRVSA